MYKALTHSKVSGTRPSDIKLAINDLVLDGSEYGAIYSGSSYSVIFASDGPEQRLLGPAILEQNQYSDHLYVKHTDSQVYILAINDGEFLAEYQFDTLNPDPEEIERLQAFVGLYNSTLEKWAYTTNASVEASKGGASFDGLIELPVLPENRSSEIDLNDITPVTSEELKKSRSKREKAKLKGLAVVAVFLCAFMAFFFFRPEAPKPVQPVKSPAISKVTKAQPNEYRGLKAFYTQNSIEPRAVLRNFYRDITGIDNIRGWRVVEAKVAINESGQLSEVIKVTSQVGKMVDLSAAVNKGGFALNVIGKDAYLAKTLSTQPLFDNYAKFHIGSFHTWLSSAVDEWWSDVDYSIKKVTTAPTEPWSISQAEITFPDIHPLDLPNIGGLVHGMPYSFKYLQIKTVNQVADTWEAVLQFEIAGVEANDSN